jgi:hypothetical protein
MKTRGLVAIVAIATVALALKLWIGAGTDEGSASDSQLLANRVWLDRLPRDEKETVNVFAAVTRRSVGFFQATTRWKGSYELFQFEALGPEMRVVYPQTGEKERIRARAWECNERNNMDYCLDIAGSSRGVKRYYSRRGWEIRATADARHARAEVDAIVGVGRSAE